MWLRVAASAYGSVAVSLSTSVTTFTSTTVWPSVLAFASARVSATIFTSDSSCTSHGLLPRVLVFAPACEHGEQSLGLHFLECDARCLSLSLYLHVS